MVWRHDRPLALPHLGRLVSPPRRSASGSVGLSGGRSSGRAVGWTRPRSICRTPWRTVGRSKAVGVSECRKLGPVGQSGCRTGRPAELSFLADIERSGRRVKRKGDCARGRRSTGRSLARLRAVGEKGWVGRSAGHGWTGVLRHSRSLPLLHAPGAIPRENASHQLMDNNQPLPAINQAAHAIAPRSMCIRPWDPLGASSSQDFCVAECRPMASGKRGFVAPLGCDCAPLKRRSVAAWSPRVARGWIPLPVLSAQGKTCQSCAHNCLHRRSCESKCLRGRID